MGFEDPATMRRGLTAVRDAPATTVGTITVDSYTRVGDHEAARQALRNGSRLNGYPITAHSRDVTRDVVRGLADQGFPVQVRHGSSDPEPIIAAMLAAGLDATEGGPVSYCLPYGRTPLRDSVERWGRACEMLAGLQDTGRHPHVETFGGCMLGQLCPPGLLVALSVLEAVFFAQRGLRDVSLSYAQQIDPEQDREAVAALERLAGRLLPAVRWHIVVYAYMGVYPRTRAGALRLLGDAAELAAGSAADRLIVKTVAEAHRIPTIEENVEALVVAHETAARAPALPPVPADNETYREALALVEAVLDLHPDMGTALLRAFANGYLDVPYCLHPDNRGGTSSRISGGRLRWADTGAMPIRVPPAERSNAGALSSDELLDALSRMERKYDAPAASPAAGDRTSGSPTSGSPTLGGSS
jgi:methylaspartate mutase epsilon subunit